MLATLRFNLEDPDDRTAHMRCVKALDMALCLHTIQEAMIKARESIDDDGPDEDAEGNMTPAGFLRKLREAFEDYSIETDELTR